MNAYVVIFNSTERDGTSRVYRAVTISASRWSARVDATRGYPRTVVESVEERLPNVNARVFMEELPN